MLVPHSALISRGATVAATAVSARPGKRFVLEGFCGRKWGFWAAYSCHPGGLWGSCRRCRPLSVPFRL